MAESTEPTDRNTAEDMGNEAPKKRRSTRKTTRRATAKAAAPDAEQPTGQDETKAREDKVRVHVLAKSLGRTSRELVEAATGLGLKKVAQSTLTPEEARRVVEALTSAQPQPDPAAVKVAQAVDQRRIVMQHRVAAGDDEQQVQVGRRLAQGGAVEAAADR